MIILNTLIVILWWACGVAFVLADLRNDGILEVRGNHIFFAMFYGAVYGALYLFCHVFLRKPIMAFMDRVFIKYEQGV